MGLEHLIAEPRIGAFAVNTKEGAVVKGEEVGERGKYRRDAAHFINNLSRYMKHNGKDLLRYLGKDAEKYLENHLNGAGSVRIPNVRYGNERAMAATFPALGYIVSNGYGGGWSEGIDDFANAHGLTHRQAREYVLSHETVHFAGVMSEAGVEERLYHYFINRAQGAKTKEARNKYLHMAHVAHARAHYYHHAEKSHGNHATAQKSTRRAAQQEKKPVGQKSRTASQQYTPNHQNSRPTYQNSLYHRSQSNQQSYKKAA